MGFPVGYTDLFIPPLFLHTLTFLTLFRNLLLTLFSSLGLPTFLHPNPNPYPTQLLGPSSPSLPRPHLSAVLTRELLTLVKVSDLETADRDDDGGYCCSVCLYEVNGDDVIRWLDNCKHIFHRECLDRWIDLDHHTCPLCRKPFLRDELIREFNLLRHDDFSHDFDQYQYQYDDDHDVLFSPS